RGDREVLAGRRVPVDRRRRREDVQLTALLDGGGLAARRIGGVGVARGEREGRRDGDACERRAAWGAASGTASGTGGDGHGSFFCRTAGEGCGVTARTGARVTGDIGGSPAAPSVSH